MRRFISQNRFRFAGSLLILFAWTVAATAQQSTPVKSAQQPTPQSTTADEDGEPRDYYTRRAREMLADDAALDNVKQHPLALNYPEHYVVVCDAGCLNRKAQIVYIEAHDAREPAVIGEMVPTSSGMENAAAVSEGENIVRCLAGCYGSKKVYQATNVFPEMADAVATELQDVSSAESGSWMTTINHAQSPEN